MLMVNECEEESELQVRSLLHFHHSINRKENSRAEQVSLWYMECTPSRDAVHKEPWSACLQ